MRAGYMVFTPVFTPVEVVVYSAEAALIVSAGVAGAASAARCQLRSVRTPGAPALLYAWGALAALFIGHKLAGRSSAPNTAPTWKSVFPFVMLTHQPFHEEWHRVAAYVFWTCCWLALVSGAWALLQEGRSKRGDAVVWWVTVTAIAIERFEQHHIRAVIGMVEPPERLVEIRRWIELFGASLYIWAAPATLYFLALHVNSPPTST